MKFEKIDVTKFNNELSFEEYISKNTKHRDSKDFKTEFIAVSFTSKLILNVKPSSKFSLFAISFNCFCNLSFIAKINLSKKFKESPACPSYADRSGIIAGRSVETEWRKSK